MGYVRDISDQAENYTKDEPTDKQSMCKSVSRHAQSFDLQMSLKVMGLSGPDSAHIRDTSDEAETYTLYVHSV